MAYVARALPIAGRLPGTTGDGRGGTLIAWIAVTALVVLSIHGNVHGAVVAHLAHTR